MKNFFKVVDEIKEECMMMVATHENLEHLENRAIEHFNNNYQDLETKNYLQMNYSDGIMNIDISPILIQEIKLKYPEAFI
jgi:hypothetical protein